MNLDLHLTLRELSLAPAGEWSPPVCDWLVARASEGVGYWLQDGTALELNAGDGFVIGGKVNSLLRVSRLGPLKLQFFTVRPKYLHGLLSVLEWHRLEAAAANPVKRVCIFPASEPVAQKFSRLSELPVDCGLTLRCEMLQIWSAALEDLLKPSAPQATGDIKLGNRFSELIGNLTEAELADASLTDLAARLHCSERHFSRMFRLKFGVNFQAHRIELRLRRAQQLLSESNARIHHIALDSGYRHLGLFNAMFKRRFGLTPSQWRQQNGAGNKEAQTLQRFS